MLFVGIEHEEHRMGEGHLSADERRMLYQWRGDGCTLAEIGKRLNRDKGTISRELRRNKGARGYRSTQAQAMAQERAKRGGRRTFTDAMQVEIAEGLRKGWTPAIISGRAGYEGRAMISREWIYQYIYAEGKAGNALWTKLPRAKRKRHRRCPRQDGRGRGQIPNQRRIDQRPKVVDKRERVGDWEGDLMSGAPRTGNLATLVERHSLYTLVGRVGSIGETVHGT
jgi:IS30 family transposase